SGQAVVPALQGQCGTAAVVRPGLQPGQLPSAVGTAQANPELDADYASGEVSQDRGQGGVARQVQGLLTGGSSSAPPAVRGPCGKDRLAPAGVCLGVRLTVMDKTVCVSSPCVPGALYGSSSVVEQRRSVLYDGSRQRRNGWLQRFLG